MLALSLLLAVALFGDPATAKDQTAGTSQSEIRLGMSADFSASARALSIELYRGAMAYLLPLNNAGGVNGRRVVIKAYDDQYEPDLAIRNTLKLMDEDDVFALFSYVGTPDDEPDPAAAADASRQEFSAALPLHRGKYQPYSSL
jgi:branched-chain amino acid transport system substrate-binding protein